MSEVRIYTEGDANPGAISSKKVAVLGFGSQGSAHAKLLHERGLDVRVGLKAGSASAQKVKAAGIPLMSVADAVKEADIIVILLPDTAQSKVYREEIEPNLKPGATLLFAHGFNIHFGQIKPPANVDVIMVAPKSPGAMLYREASGGNGVPALIAIHQDASGKAHEVALAYAHAIGSTRAGVIETTFKDETETDLFGEQAVLCGGISALILNGFETLVAAGYKPELAYFECLHETKLIVDLIYQGGLTSMRRDVSDTAEWGDYVSGPRVVGAPSRKAMQEVLSEIQSGDFAKRWISESQGDAVEFNRLREEGRSHPIEEVGARLRSRMTWLQK